jgi:CBS domain-containing protein
VSLGLEAPAREALKLMCEDNVPGVPVVDEDGALEGFVTVGYLIASALPRYMRLMDNLS